MKCVPEERISKILFDTVSDAKLDFDDFQSAMKDVALITDGNTGLAVAKKPKKRKRSKKKARK